MKTFASIRAALLSQSNWVLLVTFLLLNLPFYFMQFEYVLRRPAFTYEYLIPLILSVVSRVLALSVLVLLQGMDFLISIAGQYHFRSAADFFRYLLFAPEINIIRFQSLQGTVIVLALIAYNWCILKFSSKRMVINHVLYSAVGLVGVLIVADFYNGSSGLKRAEMRRISTNIVGSPIANLVFAVAKNPQDDNSPIPTTDSLMGRENIMGWAREHPSGNVVLVIVESLGLHKNVAINEYLSATLVAELNNDYTLKQHNIPFYGSTTYAELRELCAERGPYYSIAAPNQCIPHQFRSIGWHTVGAHNFSARMFDRNRWWPQIGIDEQLFANELYQVSPALCDGAFRGPCDETNIRFLFGRLHGSKQFLYGLTVNAHLPLLDTEVEAGLLALCSKHQLAHVDCLLNEMHRRVLHSINAEMRQQAQEGRRALVLVVGDHSPPFGERKLSSLYSQALVPGFALRPRD